MGVRRQEDGEVEGRGTCFYFCLLFLFCCWKTWNNCSDKCEYTSFQKTLVPGIKMICLNWDVTISFQRSESLINFMGTNTNYFWHLYKEVRKKEELVALNAGMRNGVLHSPAAWVRNSSQYVGEWEEFFKITGNVCSMAKCIRAILLESFSSQWK